MHFASIVVVIRNNKKLIGNAVTELQERHFTLENLILRHFLCADQLNVCLSFIAASPASHG